MVKTETGSVYRILDDSWERVSAESTSGQIRTDFGKIHDLVGPEIGWPMVIWTEALDPEQEKHGLYRYIRTSKVVEIQDLAV